MEITKTISLGITALVKTRSHRALASASTLWNRSGTHFKASSLLTLGVNDTDINQCSPCNALALALMLKLPLGVNIP